MSIIRRPWSVGGGDTKAAAYAAIGEILGAGNADYAIVPLGDTDHENLARTTVTTVGQGAGVGLVFTYSEAITAWDTPPVFQSGKFWLPTVQFNGVDEEAIAPDNVFWSLISGGTDAPASVGVWATVPPTSNYQGLFSRFDDPDDEEWMLRINTLEKIEFLTIDASQSLVTLITSSSPFGPQFQHIVTTYDGRGGTNNATGLEQYSSGVFASTVEGNGGVYVDMEDKGGETKIGSTHNTSQDFFTGKMYGSALGPFVTKRLLSLSDLVDLHTISLGAI